MLAGVCLFFLRRKKQRRVHTADLAVPATTSHNHPPDGGLQSDLEAQETRSVNLDVQPSHPEMTELRSNDATDHSSISGSTTSRIRRIPVPSLLDDPFADEPRISELSFTEITNPFADPADERLSSSSTSSNKKHPSGEVTPVATQPSRLSAGSSLVGEEYASGQLTPKAIEPSRLSAGSSLIAGAYASSEAGTVSQSALPFSGAC